MEWSTTVKSDGVSFVCHAEMGGRRRNKVHNKINLHFLMTMQNYNNL